MLGILVGLMFGVIMASFVFTMGSSAEGIASSEIEINNTRQMSQLVLYDSLIAYQCSPNQGGYEILTKDETLGSYWSAWTEYKDASGASATAINWDHLEAAGSNLKCYGSESKLPGTDGALDFALDNSWLNDQQGKYSRKDFRITKKVILGPCIAYENGDSGPSGSDPQDAVFLFSDESSNPGAAVTNYARGGILASITSVNNRGPNYGFGGKMNPSDCMKPNHWHGGGTTDSIVSVVTVIGAEDVEDDITGEGWDHVDSSSITGTQGDDSFTVYKYKLCKGTRGYIQTNVGPNSDEKSRGLDYSVENPPGSADVETGNDRETNIIHPFIVFTEWNDDCYP